MVDDRTPAAGIQVAKHASESGHWYDRSANLIDGVPYKSGAKKGQTRKPTLADARERDLAPGCTTIIRCASAPALVKWQIDQAILAALTLPRADGETEDDWLARVHQDRQEHAKQAAEEGTRIHAAIQDAVEGRPYDPGYAAHVAKVLEILTGLTGSWLIDFKGKEGTQEQLDNLRTYESHWMQLAATEEALMHLGATTGGAWMSEVACVHHGGYGTKADLLRTESRFLEVWPANIRRGICYVSRDNPGAAALVEVKPSQIGRGWDMFRAQLRYWQALNDYRPSWAEPF